MKTEPENVEESKLVNAEGLPASRCSAGFEWLDIQVSQPDINEEIWYFSQWIGSHEGLYKGLFYCEFDEMYFHHFEGSGGNWKCDTPTFWMPRNPKSLTP